MSTLHYEGHSFNMDEIPAHQQPTAAPQETGGEPLIDRHERPVAGIEVFAGGLSLLFLLLIIGGVIAAAILAGLANEKSGKIKPILNIVTVIESLIQTIHDCIIPCDCTRINSIPADGLTLSVNGTCIKLTSDIFWSATNGVTQAILINGASNVDIDLNGHTLTVPAGKRGITLINSRNVHVHAGSIRSTGLVTGGRGITITNSTNVLLERLDVGYIIVGLVVSGTNNAFIRVQDSLFHDTATCGPDFASSVSGGGIEIQGGTSNFYADRVHFSNNRCSWSTDYDYIGRDFRIVVTIGSVENVRITHCHFTDARASFSIQGGVSLRGVTIEDCEFHNSQLGYAGYFIFVAGGSVEQLSNFIIRRSLFVNQLAAPIFDGLELSAGSHYLIEDNTFEINNTAWEPDVGYGGYPAGIIHLGQVRSCTLLGDTSCSGVAEGVYGATIRRNAFRGGFITEGPRSVHAVQIEAYSRNILIEHNDFTGFDSGAEPDNFAGPNFGGTIYVDAEVRNVQILYNSFSDIRFNTFSGAPAIAIYLAGNYTIYGLDGVNTTLANGSRGCIVRGNNIAGVMGACIIDDSLPGYNIVGENMMVDWTLASVISPSATVSSQGSPSLAGENIISAAV